MESVAVIDRNTHKVTCGLKTALWGFFCKLVVADKIALVVDTVYADPLNQSAATLLVTIYLYSFQIYFDFYGYTNISIGLSKLLGIELNINFNNPYLATSLRDFWRRWHITLSTWLRDYIYLPLGGRAKSFRRYSFIILFVFLLSGLWHGAGLNFVFWGGIHALLFLGGHITSKYRLIAAEYLGLNRLPWVLEALRIITTFSIVSFAWVPFRIESISIVDAIFRQLTPFTESAFSLAAIFFQVDTIVYLIILVITFWVSSAGLVHQIIKCVPATKYEAAGELILVNVMVILLVLLGDIGTREFIYFRF